MPYAADATSGVWPPREKDTKMNDAMSVTAVRAETEIVIDGRLDDAAWLRAPAYRMALSADLEAQGRRLAEGGTVRFAWDERFFYLGVDYEDSDVVAEGTADGEHHYQLGDVAELFLWPEDYPWYWELYVTPAGRQSAFFFPSAGRGGLPSTFRHHFSMRVAAQVNGTLNDWSDRDRGWTAEMAVPVRELVRHGGSFGPGSRWRVFVGRYNYSAHLPARELSMCPPLPQTSFHMRPHYARIEFAP